DGLTGGGGSKSGGGPASGPTGNLASDAVSAALAYRAQAPLLDGLMKELGLDGSSLGTLVQAAQDPNRDTAKALSALSSEGVAPEPDDPAMQERKNVSEA
ncbi:MAG: hypothetical protein C0472_01490, partial [Erythrobacter sp.]|nr:hypothetical protein [Erythrobacter sp.]